MSVIIDEGAQRFGLPLSLLVPIAARSVEDVEAYVGELVERLVGRTGRVNALAIASHHRPVVKEPTTLLWQQEQAATFEQRLHPDRQIWVHVDFSAYRRAYVRLGGAAIPTGYFLDHVQNREAIRLRGYSHPYLRLCPVSRLVNTSGGTNAGGEGMEKEFLRSINEGPADRREEFFAKLDHPVVYADPMDLTKMLDIAPGTQVLGGVGEMLKLFYAD